jgi:hypothetical protein
MVRVTCLDQAVHVHVIVLDVWNRWSPLVVMAFAIVMVIPFLWFVAPMLMLILIRFQVRIQASVRWIEVLTLTLTRGIHDSSLAAGVPALAMSPCPMCDSRVVSHHTSHKQVLFTIHSSHWTVRRV